MSIYPTSEEQMIMRNDLINTEKQCVKNKSNRLYIDFFRKYRLNLIIHVETGVNGSNNGYFIGPHSAQDFLGPVRNNEKITLAQGYDHFREILRKWFGYKDRFGGTSVFVD